MDVVEHLAALRRYARALTLDGDAADDLVQQALLRACERSHTFRAGSAVRPWLFAILHNEFVSGRRRASAERRALLAVAPPAEPAGDADAAEQASLLRQTSVHFAGLPSAQREVLHLIAVEGMSYQQAADALAVPIGTIMSRLNRARTAMREAVAGDGRRPPSLHLIGGKDA